MSLCTSPIICSCSQRLERHSSHRSQLRIWEDVKCIALYRECMEHVRFKRFPLREHHWEENLFAAVSRSEAHPYYAWLAAPDLLICLMPERSLRESERASEWMRDWLDPEWSGSCNLVDKQSLLGGGALSKNIPQDAATSTKICINNAIFVWIWRIVVDRVVLQQTKWNLL